jgi:hypothetical protein
MSARASCGSAARRPASSKEAGAGAGPGRSDGRARRGPGIIRRAVSARDGLSAGAEPVRHVLMMSFPSTSSMVMKPVSPSTTMS